MDIPKDINEEKPGFDLSGLSVEKKKQFLKNYEYYKKRLPVAFILALFFGLHYVYLGKWKLQILMIVTIGGLGIWWLIDMFRVTGMVQRYNQQLGEEILAELRQQS